MRVPGELTHQITTSDLMSRPQGGSLMVRGLIYDDREPNRDLAWPYSRDVYDAMRVDSQIHGLLRSVTLPILKAKRILASDGVKPEVLHAVRMELGIAEDGTALKRRNGQGIRFDEFMNEALTALIYGHAVFEQVYEVGPSYEDPTAKLAEGEPDAAPDGAQPKRKMAHIRKLAYVHPKLIEDWRIDRFGDLNHLIVETTNEQNALEYVPVPINTLVLFVHGKLGANWWGESFLRPLYKDWYLKDTAERLASIKIDRSAVGIPWVQYSSGTKAEAATIGKNMRSGESAFIATELGAYQISIVGTDSKGSEAEVLSIIEHHQQQMSKAWLAQVMDLGHDGGLGSGNLSETFMKMFSEGVNAIARIFAEVISEHIIRDFVRLNWGEDEPYPELSFAPITPELSPETFGSLVSAGVLTPDEELESYFRDRFGMPTLQPGARGALAAEKAQQEADAARAMQAAVPPDPAQGAMFSEDEAHLAFDNSKHPRGGKGTKQGGRFVRKGMGGDPLSTPTSPTAGKTLKTAPDQLTPDGVGKVVKRGAESLADAVKANGGFSYRPVSHLTPSTGYMVSPYPDRETAIDGPPTRRDIVEFMIANADLIDQPGHFVGGWYNPDDKRTYLDVSVRASSHEAAVDLARERNQYGYYDLTKGQFVAVEGRTLDRATNEAISKGKGDPAAPTSPDYEPTNVQRPEVSTTPKTDKAPEIDLEETLKRIALAASWGSTGSIRIHESNLRPLVEAMADDKAAGPFDQISALDIHERPRIFQGLGYKRAEMPQISAEKLPGFLDQLRADGIGVEGPLPGDPRTYRASQSQLDGAKAGGIMRAGAHLQTPCLVTSDGWVVDGHHRWLAATVAGDQLPVIKLNMPIKDALKRSYDYMLSVKEGPKLFGQK